MIPADEFCVALDDRGFTFFTGVPCSHLAAPIALLSARRGGYLPAANEGAALALAAGASLAGHRSVVLAQNSGFGNLVNPLTSLLMTYDIPVLVCLSLRGWPDPTRDEPQHAVMGATTHALLDTLGVARFTLPREASGLPAVLDEVDRVLAARRPVFLLVPAGVLGPVGDRGGITVPSTASPPPTAAPAAGVTRADLLDGLAERLAGACVVATTGYMSRSLFARGDQDTNFYMQGSMGHALAIGLGLALTRPDRRVVVLDGDGAAIMHLGSMSTVGAAGPPNLLHVVYDNGQYESTGAQPTTSSTVSFADVARAVGYRHAVTCQTVEELAAALRGMPDRGGPSLIAVRGVAAVDPTPPRATASLAPVVLRGRFEAALGGPR